ncbi:MAG: hypothetical protein FWC69_06535, partial [Defluviitaleaceae bacterium]|nr:hypothetical protein [Defluviitaleaceae bacterium]
VCAVSGFLPSAACFDGSGVRSELFAPGTAPVSQCTICVHEYVEIDTGLLPSQWTPPHRIERRSFITRDRGWQELVGNVAIRDAHREAPREESTFFNPFVDNDYWDSTVPHHYDDDTIEAYNPNPYGYFHGNPDDDILAGEMEYGQGISSPPPFGAE